MRTRTALRRLSTWAGLALLVAGGAAAQQDRYRPPSKTDATTLALNWVIGRFRMPVTCTRTDGSQLQLEEAVVIRPAPEHSGKLALKATFFGIDAADVSHCFNLVFPRLPDRRGILYLTFRSHERTDLGMADFRRRMRDGELRYPIQDGQLREREFGETKAKPRVVKFDRRGVEFLVRDIRAGSDADKLLARYTEAASPRAYRPRRLEFEITGPDDYVYRGYFIEDPAWRK
jgi:hypothetical protein